jgi:hypothetical protein
MPITLISAPLRHGEVVDSDSNKPIAGAAVYYKQYPDNRVLTESDGRFRLPEVKKAALMPLFLGPIDYAPPRGILVFDADGYETYEVDIRGSHDPKWEEATGMSEIRVKLQRCR